MMAETASQGTIDWVAAEIMVAVMDRFMKSWLDSEVVSVKAETAGVGVAVGVWAVSCGRRSWLILMMG